MEGSGGQRKGTLEQARGGFRPSAHDCMKSGTGGTEPELWPGKLGRNNNRQVCPVSTYFWQKAMFGETESPNNCFLPSGLSSPPLTPSISPARKRQNSWGREGCFLSGVVKVHVEGHVSQEFVGRSGTGREGCPRKRRGGRRAHLLGDRVDEPDVQVLLRADTCRGGERGRAQDEGCKAPPTRPQPVPGSNQAQAVARGCGPPDWAVLGAKATHPCPWP